MNAPLGPVVRTAAPNTRLSGDALVAALVLAAFAQPRMQRSGFYLAGINGALRLQACSEPMRCPWRAGSAECDAFYAGVDEGLALWRDHKAAWATCGDGLPLPSAAGRWPPFCERPPAVWRWGGLERRRAGASAGTSTIELALRIKADAALAQAGGAT